MNWAGTTGGKDDIFDRFEGWRNSGLGGTMSLESNAKRAVANYLVGDRHNGRRRRSSAPYGISVTDVSLADGTLAITLILRAGQRYCCETVFCGFPPVWDEL